MISGIPQSDHGIIRTWAGELRLGDRWATWRGAVGDGTTHRHFAAQAVISDQPVRTIDAQGHFIEARCVLVDPLTPHRIEPGARALLVYIEPSGAMTTEAEELLRPLREGAVPQIVTQDGKSGFWAAWLSSPSRPPPAIDDRLLAALERIEEVLPFGSVPLQLAAARAGLSPDRFRHLFGEQVGLPFKRYVLWRRLRLAASELVAGSDVTAAAHAAGFADAAHLARTLKSMFGVTASQVLLAR